MFAVSFVSLRLNLSAALTSRFVRVGTWPGGSQSCRIVRLGCERSDPTNERGKWVCLVLTAIDTLSYESPSSSPGRLAPWRQASNGHLLSILVRRLRLHLVADSLTSLQRIERLTGRL